MLKKIENDPHEKDARTPRAALLLLVQAPEQNRVGRDNLKNRIEGGHNGIRFLNGNNLTVTLSKNLALFCKDVRRNVRNLPNLQTTFKNRKKNSIYGGCGLLF